MPSPATINRIITRMGRRQTQTSRLPVMGATCPLGCDAVPLHVNGRRLYYSNHMGTHPQSFLCYWSGQPVTPRVGKTRIRVEFFIPPVAA